MKTVQIEDLYAYKMMGGLCFNPSKTKFVYTVYQAEEQKNTYRQGLYLFEQGEVHQLLQQKVNVLLWLDDEQLLVSKNVEGQKADETHLFVLNIHRGEPLPLCIVPIGVEGAKRLDEQTIILQSTIHQDHPDWAKYSDAKRAEILKQKEEQKDYTEVSEIPYWFNGSGFIDGLRQQLYTFDLNTYQVERISDIAYNVDSFEVHRGELWMITSKKEAPLQNQIWYYHKKKWKKALKSDAYGLGRLFFLHDQAYVEFTDHQPYGVNQTLNIGKIEKNRIVLAYTPEYSLYNSVASDTTFGAGKISDQGQEDWYTLSTVIDHTEIHRFDSHFQKEVILAGCQIKEMIVNDYGIYYVETRPDHLNEIYFYDFSTKLIEQISHENDAYHAKTTVQIPQEIKYVSEGIELNGWVILPSKYHPKKKYPAILDIHGGPRTVYGENFFHEMQVWAAKGYIVMFTNIRGSDGRGDAFADIRDQYGQIDYQNLMDFVDRVMMEYAVDEKRLFVTGGSYGGFMTNWIIGHTDRFKAAASQRSISNWISMSYLSDIGPYFGPDQNGADQLFGQENIQRLWEHSPLKYAQNVQTPTLFIHSDQDYRCPLPEGMQMMQALKVRQIDTKLVIFHGENHELSRSGKPKHRIKRLQEITNWFEKYCKK